MHTDRRNKRKKRKNINGRNCDYNLIQRAREREKERKRERERKKERKRERL